MRGGRRLSRDRERKGDVGIRGCRDREGGETRKGLGELQKHPSLFYFRPKLFDT